MNALLQALQGVGASRILVLLIVSASVIGLLGYFGTRLTEPPMTILYGDLEPKDAGQIVARLETMTIPYELRAGGTQVFVPTDKVLRLRMAMAEAGLPNGGSVGFEVFDRSDNLGSTRTMQNINMLRALAGELERTIKSLSQINAARVHLVIPKRDLFARNKQQSSASIILGMIGGNRLSKAQVSAIRHLVASAVPGLKPNQVSVVDNRGNLLARGGDQDDEGLAAAGAQDFRAAYESRLTRAIEQLLEQTLGVGRVRAQVSAEINFDRITTNSEIYDPDGQVVRSSQIVEERSLSAAGGSNQAVSVSTSLPSGDGGDGGIVSSNSDTTERIEETTNYEITKTIRSHVSESGTVKRLSVAVLVDGIYTQGSDGESSYQPRSEEEIAQLTVLVKTAVGFNAERGDSLEVVNMPFARVDIPEGEDPPLVDLGKGDYFKIAEIAVMFVVGILVVLMVLKPLAASAMGGAGGMQRMIEDEGESQAALAAPEGDQAAVAQLPPSAAAEMPPIPPSQLDNTINVANVEGRMKVSSMKRVGEIVDSHPDEALNIIRNWIHQEV
ncbi:MAG: flagellar M-ring protein FliF [Proteobacteria bacterium]|nr:flagellar M-ring protein FliF [Pseudomonadota bacterium]